MSTKNVVHTTELRSRPLKSTQSEAVPPPDIQVGLAESILDILDYICSRDDDTVELADRIKPRLEAIARRAGA